MHDSFVTLAGNIATDPRHVETDGGLHITSFRLAVTPRRNDRSRGWIDTDTSYYSVTCFRFLAQNVAASMAKGDPVFVTGTQRVREWERDGRTGVTTEVDARVVGHDLNRGVSRFTKVTRARPVAAEEDEALRSSVADGGHPADGDDPDEAVPAGVDTRTGEIHAQEATAA